MENTHPTPIQAFADKHDICEFGRELLIKRQHITTLEDAWLAGDTLCVMFMYVKGVHTATGHVFYVFANQVANDLFRDGFTAQAQVLRGYIDAHTDIRTTVIELQTSMRDALLEGKRKESHQSHAPRLLTSLARDIGLFALDFASQVRYTGFSLKFSYESAQLFRKIVGSNPFKGQ